MSITPAGSCQRPEQGVHLPGSRERTGGAFFLLNYNDDRRATLGRVLSLHPAGALLGLQAVAAAFQRR